MILSFGAARNPYRLVQVRGVYAHDLLSDVNSEQGRFLHAFFSQHILFNPACGVADEMTTIEVTGQLLRPHTTNGYATS